MSTEKDLNYWKANAEEDYKQVPISVLRYITELETVVKNCSIPFVVGQSEQLFKLRNNCVNGVDDEVCRNSGICKYCS